MENLTINDDGPQRGGSVGGGASTFGMGPPPSQQLPPQMFTTAAQLLDLTDKKLMVALRDGRKLIGVLRSWDQFANLILQYTIERLYVPPSPATDDRGLYADSPRGTFLVRGENVLLLGEIDLDKEDDEPAGYERADLKEVEGLRKELGRREGGREKVLKKRLGELGFEGESLREALL
ncbi:hypothetical protein BJ875DRAFT_270470 [Amylocarpus encephaloides]|uniref:U6 snRNA-associated Sm-like protein LSm1 n=1 Tax=Amylocarpus encephaloides TaxID=45428 RepID=A0A9P7YL02_9HELO|nr:hypothetical protein BJ875DRAFT_270470 [Amylocarpus encephaloides]